MPAKRHSHADTRRRQNDGTAQRVTGAKSYPKEEPAEEPATVEATPEERALWAAATEFQELMTEVTGENLDRSRRVWSEYWDRYNPGERAFVDALFTGRDPDQAVQAAVSDVSQQFGVARGMRARAESRYGIVPGSGRFESMDRRDAMGEAAARAGAATMARRGVQGENEARKLQAVGLGRSLLPVSAGLTGQAVGAGGAGISAMSAPAGLAASRAQTNAQLQDAASGRAFQAEQGALNRQAQMQASRMESRSNLWGGIGGMVGLALGGPIGGALAGGIGNMFKRPAGPAY